MLLNFRGSGNTGFYLMTLLTKLAYTGSGLTIGGWGVAASVVKADYNACIYACTASRSFSRSAYNDYSCLDIWLIIYSISWVFLSGDPLSWPFASIIRLIAGLSEGVGWSLSRCVECSRLDTYLSFLEADFRPFVVIYHRRKTSLLCSVCTIECTLEFLIISYRLARKPLLEHKRMCEFLMVYLSKKRESRYTYTRGRISSNFILNSSSCEGLERFI